MTCYENKRFKEALRSSFPTASPGPGKQSENTADACYPWKISSKTHTDTKIQESSTPFYKMMQCLFLT